MHETTRLAGLIQERISDTLAGHRRDLKPLGHDTEPLLDEALGFLSGGKRFRAQFATLGYRAVKPLDLTGEVTSEFGAILDAACALELFHAAALIHDDLIDRSDTRRGRPSTHRLFSAMHQQHGWRGASEHFGLAGPSCWVICCSLGLMSLCRKPAMLCRIHLPPAQHVLTSIACAVKLHLGSTLTC
ncbi:polyprenyl synthetase family protein [Leucobacter coleopterorum]|uniref:polyprenyl synthetase family protein n=1 Tax=Leucobacter coleopterorum TaxID=2714933 RepID=UPI003CC70D33